MASSAVQAVQVKQCKSSSTRRTVHGKQCRQAVQGKRYKASSTEQAAQFVGKQYKARSARQAVQLAGKQYKASSAVAGAPVSRYAKSKMKVLQCSACGAACAMRNL